MTHYLRGYLEGFRHGYRGDPHHVIVGGSFHHRRWLDGYRRGWTAGWRARMRNW